MASYNRMAWDPDANNWVPVIKTKNGFSVGPNGIEYPTMAHAVDAAPQSRWLTLPDGRRFFLPDLLNKATKPETYYVGNQPGAYRCYRRLQRWRDPDSPGQKRLG